MIISEEKNVRKIFKALLHRLRFKVNQSILYLNNLHKKLKYKDKKK